jgi:hypothetical protein
MGVDVENDEDFVPTIERCCISGCTRSTTSLYCDLHRTLLARLCGPLGDGEVEHVPVQHEDVE